MKTIFAILSASLVLSGASECRGALAYTTAGSAYSQDFDGLANSGTPAWTDDTTLAGWYARSDATASIGTYAASTGSSTGGGIYSFGVAGVNTVTDRALGSKASDSFTGAANGVRQNYFGLQINNGTGGNLGQFTLQYTGEQWRKENSPLQSLVVQYKIGATAVNEASGWITISGLQFDSPQIDATPAGPIDGNDAVNRVVFTPVTTSGLTWSSGQNLWIRWTDLNDSGTDHSLAIDGVSFSGVPEPVTWAMIVFGTVLCAVQLGRLLRRHLAAP